MTTNNMNGPFRVESSNTVYSNPWIRVREDKVTRPDGKSGVFGIVEMKAGSTVLALDEQMNAYVIREYKYGIERETIELMSGGIDGNETALDAAKRELAEELRLKASEWIDLGVVDPFTTVVRSQNFMFLAMRLEPTTGMADEGEVLSFSKIPLEHAVEMVMRSEITHGASCVCILKAHRYLIAGRHS